MSMKIDSGKLYKAFPYMAAFYVTDKISYLYRVAEGSSASDKLSDLNLGKLFGWPILSINPLDLLWGMGGCLCLLVYILYRNSTRKKLRPGEEYGNARLGTSADIKPFVNPKFRENCILSKTEFLTMEEKVKPWYMGRNKNAIFYGGSGAGKTFSMLMPNLMQFHSSYVVVDPKGTLIDSCGDLILRMGYKIKVFNTIDFDSSMGYNPFSYIKRETDIQKLVNTLMENTKEPDEKGQDPFWPKAEKLLYNALIAYIWEHEVKDAQNMITLLDLISKITVSEPSAVKKKIKNEAGEEEVFTESKDEKNEVDIKFEEHEKEYGETYAVRQYKKFLIAAGKTKRSILASVGARMSPFDIDAVRRTMEFDELELDKIGDEKTILFFIIDDSDTTFNFLVSMALSQMFNTLKTKADLSGGHLKHHVRVLWDETYNTGQVPKLEHLISQLRSRGISMWMFFQAKNQLIDLYGDKKAENIEASCDVKGFLGGNEFTSWKDWSELLGQETIDVLDQSDTYGQTRSSGNSYKKAGKKLKTVEEIGNMPGNKLLVKLRGVPPFYSDKYDTSSHPLYRYTADADDKYKFDLANYLENYRMGFLVQDKKYESYTIDLSEEGDIKAG